MSKAGIVEKDNKTDKAADQQLVRLTYSQKVILACVVVLTAIIFLWSVRSILQPFVWAVVVAYVLSPLVDWLSWKARLSRIWVVAALYVVVLGLVAWALYSLVPALFSELRDLRENYPQFIESLQNILAAQPLAFVGITLDLTILDDALNEAARQLPSTAFHAVTQAVEIFGKGFLFLVATFYLLHDGARIINGIIRLVPESYQPETRRLILRVNNVLGSYIRGQIFLVVLMSTVTWVVVGGILHLRFALLVSLMTGVLELFPLVGPVAAGAVAVSIGLFQINDFGWPSWVFALVLAGVYTVLRYSEDYLVIPNVIGRVVELHPLMIIFALVCGAVLGGVLGMLIAVPMAAVVKVIGRYIHAKLTY
ncbi:MAG: AI-2E family transporter [Chloroflexota bacterium]|nr:MAG: AI-2E family transporter [Chloroflexota bacterium]